MATSLVPVDIARNTWVDLYDATGITVGVQIIIQNTGTSTVLLTESALSPTGPTNDVGTNPISPLGFFTNNTGNVGAWAFSSDDTTTLQIEEA